MLSRALLAIAFWISAWLKPRTKFYEPTSAEIVQALKLSQVRARARNAIK